MFLNFKTVNTLFSYKEKTRNTPPAPSSSLLNWYNFWGICMLHFSFFNHECLSLFLSFFPRKGKRKKKQKVAQLKTENTSYSSLHLMSIKVGVLLSFVLICATAVSPSWKVHIWAFLLHSYMLKGYIHGKQILFFPSPSPRSLPKLISYLFYVLKVNFV